MPLGSDENADCVEVAVVDESSALGCTGVATVFEKQESALIQFDNEAQSKTCGLPPSVRERPPGP